MSSSVQLFVFQEGASIDDFCLHTLRFASTSKRATNQQLDNQAHSRMHRCADGQFLPLAWKLPTGKPRWTPAGTVGLICHMSHGTAACKASGVQSTDSGSRLDQLHRTAIRSEPSIVVCCIGRARLSRLRGVSSMDQVRDATNRTARAFDHGLDTTADALKSGTASASRTYGRVQHRAEVI